MPMFRNMSKDVNKGQKMVKRFALGPRLAHWIYAFTFLMLWITAMPKVFNWEGFKVIYTLFGGPAGTHLAHRIFAVIMIGTVVLTTLLDWKNTWKWLRELKDWRKRDFSFLMIFPKEFFGLPNKYPKQGYLNGGTKINSILQIVCFFGFAISGIFMWFPNILPYTVQVWMYPTHIIAVSFATAVVFGHIYLAALHPNSKGGLQGMIHGYVPVSYAAGHHGAWYDEVVEECKKDKKSKDIMTYEEFCSGADELASKEQRKKA